MNDWGTYRIGDRVKATRVTSGGVTVTREFDVAVAKIGLREHDSYLVDGDGERYWLTVWDVERVVVPVETPAQQYEYAATVRLVIDVPVTVYDTSEEEALSQLSMMSIDLVNSEYTEVSGETTDIYCNGKVR